MVKNKVACRLQTADPMEAHANSPSGPYHAETCIVFRVQAEEAFPVLRRRQACVNQGSVRHIFGSSPIKEGTEKSSYRKANTRVNCTPRGGASTTVRMSLR
jgi:hypothetical protein